MKHVASLAFLFCCVSLSWAQIDCHPFVPNDTGTKWEVTDYSPKGKVLGRTTFELVDKVIDGDNITFKVATTYYDKKDKESFTHEFEAYCKGGTFEFDMSYRMNGGTMQAYQNMDFEVDATSFTVPDLDAKAGTTLPDGSLAVSVGSGGVNMFKMKVDITDRKLEAREELTTPAGTFPCAVLSQTVTTKMIMKVQASSKEWYSEGVGMVRSESYNKKGKMTGYSELTKLEK
ncbi:MAG: hypothetical protein F6K19_19300 [Cyanothece sp. SIO1E1]|nr:hypothetical protein [Cyanothece sp. SIO1E1]